MVCRTARPTPFSKVVLAVQSHVVHRNVRMSPDGMRRGHAGAAETLSMVRHIVEDALGRLRQPQRGNVPRVAGLN